MDNPAGVSSPGLTAPTSVGAVSRWETCLGFPPLAGHLVYAAWFNRCRWLSHCVGVW